MLRDWFAGPPSQRDSAQKVLQYPWCWPSSPLDWPELRDLEPPEAPTVGEVLLLSATQSDDGPAKGGLWRFGPARESGTPLLSLAAATRERAEALVTQEIPLLLDLLPERRKAAPETARWRLQQICRSDRDHDPALGGSSCGLAMALAVASFLLQRPVPVDLVATASIGSDGATQPVDGLAAKLEVLVGAAPAVRRVLVARDQVFPETLRLPERLQIIPVDSVAIALQKVFPCAGGTSPWEEEPLLRRSLDAFAGAFLEGASLRWGAPIEGIDHPRRRLRSAVCQLLAGRQALDDTRLVAQSVLDLLGHQSLDATGVLDALLALLLGDRARAREAVARATDPGRAGADVRGAARLFELVLYRIEDHPRVTATRSLVDQLLGEGASAPKPEGYRPEPKGTGTALLDPALETLVERLAEAVHDAWAAKRRAMGWMYGLVTSPAHRTHTNLVPFQALPESERKRDRDQVRSALGALASLGYRLRPTVEGDLPEAFRPGFLALEPPLPERYAVTRDRLAEQLYDVRTTLRQQQGWTFTSEAGASPPPYAELSQEEKEVNRRTAEGVVRALLAWGMLDTGSADPREAWLLAYDPHPLGEALEMSPRELEVREALARNAHDVWAADRFAQGWSYAPERNDKARHHPDLVPYEDLTATQKDYDREMMSTLLKALRLLGYRVE